MSQTTDTEVQMDRRAGDRRAQADRRQQDVPVANDRRQGERRKVQRRRQIDPTTCERDYNGDEIEFMQALDAYKRSSGRMFPTCSEILEVIRALGYEKMEYVVDEEFEPAEETDTPQNEDGEAFEEEGEFVDEEEGEEN